MKRQRLTIIISIFTIFMFCLGAGLITAGTTVPDVIKMDNKAYEKHKKPIVVFTHKKHSKEYKLDCGECHHDSKNKPLKLKVGDNVDECIKCHPKPGLATGKKAKGLTKKQKLEYHANAIHENCKDCHKKYNKKNKLKSKDKGAAPTTCKSCHKK